jgi:hypothetical protein
MVCAARQQLAFVFGSRRERIAPIAQRDTPVSDSARRILPQHSIESVDGPVAQGEIAVVIDA